MKFLYWLVNDPTRPSEEVRQMVPEELRDDLERQLSAGWEEGYWAAHHPNGVPVAVFEPKRLVWGLSPNDWQGVVKYKRLLDSLNAKTTPNLQVLFDGCLAILASLERIPAGVDSPIVEELAQDEVEWRRQVGLWRAQSPKCTLLALAEGTVYRAYRSALGMTNKERLQRVQMLHAELRRRIDGN
jgi:hypothetical protein